MASTLPPPDGHSPSAPPRTPAPEGVDRRASPRVDVTWSVDCDDGENFLYAEIANISALGIFISTRTPPAAGASVALRFTPPGERPFELNGVVAWVNPWRPSGDNLNPGFGVRFTELTPDMRERLVSLVHAIAYLPSRP